MAHLLQKRASEMNEQLKRLRNRWDLEQTALRLQVATEKEHVKVCCPHTVVYTILSAHTTLKMYVLYVLYTML